MDEETMPARKSAACAPVTESTALWATRASEGDVRVSARAASGSMMSGGRSAASSLEPQPASA